MLVTAVQQANQTLEDKQFNLQEFQKNQLRPYNMIDTIQNKLTRVDFESQKTLFQLFYFPLMKYKNFFFVRVLYKTNQYF